VIGGKVPSIQDPPAIPSGLFRALLRPPSYPKSVLFGFGLESLTDELVLKAAEQWQLDNTENLVSQQQPNVPDPSFPIQDLITPSATTSNQWQGFRHTGHASDPFRPDPSQDPFARFEFPEVSPLWFRLGITC
jgi:hypothetical protein